MRKYCTPGSARGASGNRRPYRRAVMSEPPQPTVEFLVKGSESVPYRVVFWRDGSNLKSSCTCRGGHNRRSCKHRLALLEADVTDLVSANYADIGALHELIAGTDVAAAYEPVLEGLKGKHAISKLLPVVLPGRRKGIDPSVAGETLRQGGFMKGNGGVNYFDVYTRDLSYVGSLKTRLSVFKTPIEELLPTVEFVAFTKTDRVIHETSQGVYCAAIASDIASALRSERELPHALAKLKQALAD